MQLNNHVPIKHAAGFTLVEIMIVVAIIGLLAAIAIPNMTNARTKAQRVTCIANLRQIDGAKQQWAIETRAAQSAIPAATDIRPYLGRGTGGALPACPADAANTFVSSYTVNDLASAPACLIFPGAAGDTKGHHME